MNKTLLILLLFVICEMLVAFLFAVTAQIFYKKIGLDFKSISKGLIERLFLTIALINGYSNALTFFSALKLATRLKHNDNGEASNKFNDYYLVGNLISVMVAIGYVYLYQNFDTIALFNKILG